MSLNMYYFCQLDFGASVNHTKINIGLTYIAITMYSDPLYSGLPLMRPPLGNGKSGLIRGVASREGYIRYNLTQFVL